jgi:hypothetical protein
MSLKTGTTLVSPDGRRFRVHAVGGCNSQGEATVSLHRMDRRPREQKTVYRSTKEVEGWMGQVAEKLSCGRHL